MDLKPVIQVKNLKKTIGKKIIVENITMDIYQGEVFGFLGPNGAGKTTTIRMLLGLISISEGNVYINGVDLKKDFEKAIVHVGGIVENPDLYKFLTGYQNLVHYSRMYKNITKERIDEVVKLVGLENRIKDKVKKYSLGMRQRLGIAQALLHSPSVLILDEPTNGLDPAGIHELRNQLRTLAKEENIAILISSHLLSEMELMCDRVGIIKEGKLLMITDLNEMLANSENEKTILISVDPIEKATKYLEKQNIKYIVTGKEKQLEIPNSSIDISDLVSKLTLEGIKILGVSEVQKSLEQKYLEMTGGK